MTDRTRMKSRRLALIAAAGMVAVLPVHARAGGGGSGADQTAATYMTTMTYVSNVCLYGGRSPDRQENAAIASAVVGFGLDIFKGWLEAMSRPRQSPEMSSTALYRWNLGADAGMEPQCILVIRAPMQVTATIPGSVTDRSLDDIRGNLPGTLFAETPAAQAGHNGPQTVAANGCTSQGNTARLPVEVRDLLCRLRLNGEVEFLFEGRINRPTSASQHVTVSPVAIYNRRSLVSGRGSRSFAFAFGLRAVPSTVAEASGAMRLDDIPSGVLTLFEQADGNRAVPSEITTGLISLGSPSSGPAVIQVTSRMTEFARASEAAAFLLTVFNAARPSIEPSLVQAIDRDARFAAEATEAVNDATAVSAAAQARLAACTAVDEYRKSVTMIAVELDALAAAAAQKQQAANRAQVAAGGSPVFRAPLNGNNPGVTVADIRNRNQVALEAAVQVCGIS